MLQGIDDPIWRAEKDQGFTEQQRFWPSPMALTIFAGDLRWEPFFFWPTGATLKVNNMGDIGFRDGNGKRDREKECVFGFGRERFRGEFQFLDSCGNCLCFHIEYLQSNLYYIMTVFFSAYNFRRVVQRRYTPAAEEGPADNVFKSAGCAKGCNGVLDLICQQL